MRSGDLHCGLACGAAWLKSGLTKLPILEIGSQLQLIVDEDYNVEN